jgi:hypothetical protein
VWKNAVQRRAITDQDRAATRTGVTLAAGNPPKLQGYQSRSPISRRRKGRGTLRPADPSPYHRGGGQYAYIEMGATNPKYAGTRLPRWRKGGRIVWPAARGIAPLIGARWAQAVRDAYVGRAQLGAGETRG